jgi:Yip1 domain
MTTVWIFGVSPKNQDIPPLALRPRQLYIPAGLWWKARQGTFLKRGSSMSIIDRAKNMILKPAEEWNVVADEPATVGGLFTGYAMILALIPAVVGLLAVLVLGAAMSQYMGAAMGAMTTGALLTQTVLGYVFGLLLVLAMSYLVNAVSPSFNGKQDLVQATKVMVYAGTAAWVSSLFLIIPVLGALVYLGGLAYSVYLIYLGLNPVLGVPKEKVAGMTVVVILAYIVGAIVFYLIQQSLTGFGAMNAAMPGA